MACNPSDIDVGQPGTAVEDVEKAGESGKASAPQGTEEEARSWGKYVVGCVVVLAIVFGVLMAGSMQYDAIAMLFAYAVVFFEFVVGYPLHRRHGWAGYGRASTRFNDESLALGFCRIAKVDEQAEDEVTVDGVKRASGYTGKLFDAFPMPRHMIAALKGDAGRDFRNGMKKFFLATFIAMTIMVVSVLYFALPLADISFDWSSCSDAECKISKFERDIYDGACQQRSDGLARLVDRSAMEQQFPVDIFSGIQGTVQWAFVNIGTTVNTIIFINFASPSAIQMMWAASLASTAVLALTVWLPYTGILLPVKVLAFALMHSFHCLMLEVFSTPRRFSRFNCPKTIAFVVGFFAHFIVGIILLVIIAFLDIVIDKLTMIPSTATTTVLSLLISAGETILQIVFSKLHEVPVAAATMQLAGFQFAVYARVRFYFLTLPTHELVLCSITNMLMDIALRGVMLPIKSFQWNRELKNVGPGKDLSQKLGVYLGNMMSSITAGHVALLLVNLMFLMANPLAYSVGDAPSENVQVSDVASRYLIQFLIAAIGDMFTVLAVVGFFQLNLKPYLSACHDRLFYFGMFCTIICAAAVQFGTASNEACWLCELRDECLANVGKLVGFTNSTVNSTVS